MALGLIALIGCPGKTSNSSLQFAPTSMASGPMAQAKTETLPTAALEPSRAHGHGKRADWSLATYRNPEYGISFRYPRDYVLEEGGDMEEHSYFLKRQDELESGATLVATVLIPEDGYPNTTFELGSLQLVVNESVNRESCRAFVALGAGESGRSGIHTVTLSGTPFWWSEEGSTMADTQILERVYAGFSGERCYEVFAVVAAGEAAGAEGSPRPADTGKIPQQLEKILRSTQLQAPTVAPEEFSRRDSAPRLQSQPTSGRSANDLSFWESAYRGFCIGSIRTIHFRS